MINKLRKTKSWWSSKVLTYKFILKKKTAVELARMKFNVFGVVESIYVCYIYEMPINSENNKINKIFLRERNLRECIDYYSL